MKLIFIFLWLVLPFFSQAYAADSGFEFDSDSGVLVINQLNLPDSDGNPKIYKVVLQNTGSINQTYELVSLKEIEIFEDEQPTIDLLFIPKKGSSENLEGVVYGIDNPDDFVLVCYLKVAGRWWIKPYFTRPYTSLNSDFSFVVDVTTGGIDRQASNFAVFLFSRSVDYSVPLLGGARSLPSALDVNSIAKIIVSR